MLRYRIVSPASGGGALRSAIHELMNKIIEKTIKIDYNDILYELSNSSTSANRFSTDEEFAAQLKQDVNTTYARALLYKIEFTETKNIPVELNKITVEHLMPQTLTRWWIDNFDGNDAADIIHNKYLNCIGNLAIISGPYNFKISNKRWENKLESLKDAQFATTNEIVRKYKTWTEQDIINRNENMASRACKAIIGPLKRERIYESRAVSNEFIPGIYSFSDVTTPMNGTTPVYLIFDSNQYRIGAWKNLLPELCSILNKIDNILMKEIVEENKIHKSTNTYNFATKDPIITTNPNNLNLPIKIENTNYYVEGNISSIRSRIYSKQLLELYNLTEYFKLEVE